MKTGTLAPPNHDPGTGAPTYVVAETRSGKVRGVTTGGISTFKGIPFAAPPFGPNRFRAPQPAEPWSGVRDALEFGPKIPQPEYPPHVKLVIPTEVCTTGEDCLTLNIWSPGPGPAARPVMVWIAGGVYGYHGTGASPWYDGTAFARDGVVCVTINYRVAVDGFLFLPDAEPNRGLLDQIAALEWVRDNIAAFGGDPANVTIFGESAGALSIGTLLAMPRAEGLFRRAIIESGGAHHVISPATAHLVAQRFAEHLGVEPAREAIAAIPIERVVQAQVETEMDLGMHPDPERWGSEVVSAMMAWQPVVDGETIPAPPIERIAAGAASGVDLLAGTSTEENRLFLLAVDALDQVTPEALAGAIAAYGLPVEPTLAAYRSRYPDATSGDLMALVQGDWFWRIPAVRLADAHAPGPGATYMYEFAWRSPQFDGRLGACHGIEIPFVFDTLDKGTEHVLGASPPQQLAAIMHAAWVMFATTGECPWPKYDLSRRATMHFDTKLDLVEDPLAVERVLWEGVR